jgi:tetratricopeptide (TPR) repeat protein
LASNQYHLKAIETINNIQDQTSRERTLFISLGYYGKVKLLEGDFLQATKAYEQALEIMKNLKVENNLQFSQLNEGSAIASKELKNYKEADQHLVIASHYARLAASNKEKTNCLLSFIPTTCHLK